MYFIEYSFSQDAYHISEVDECIRHNLYDYTHGVVIDYIPLGIFDTREEADTFYKKLICEKKNY